MQDKVPVNVKVSAPAAELGRYGINASAYVGAIISRKRLVASLKFFVLCMTLSIPAEAFENRIDLLQDLNLEVGVALQGYPGSMTGSSISSLGDFNGDGIDDLAIGAPYVEGPAGAPGTVYVVYGNQPTSSPLDLETLEPEQGIIYRGSGFASLFGWRVSGIGDVNADGFDDMLVSAQAARGHRSGEVYIVFGRPSSDNNVFLLQNFGEQDGVVLTTDAFQSSLGFAATGLGDFNGDGIDDFCVTLDSSQPTKTLLFFGRTEFPASIDVTQPLGDEVLVLNNFGRLKQIARAGDINGDGLADLLMGDTQTTIEGEAYVIFGQMDLESPLDRTNLTEDLGFRIFGDSRRLGSSVAGLGDVDGDGFDDLIVGATGENDSAGAAYVLFGSNQSFGIEINVSDSPRIARIAGLGPNGGLGINVAAPGDINSDGLADIGLTGTVDISIGSRGFVLLGGASIRDGFDINTLNGSNGFELVAGTERGSGINRWSSASGDFNGDEVTDVIVSAPFSGLAMAGEVFVLFGERQQEIRGGGAMLCLQCLLVLSLFGRLRQVLTHNNTAGARR